MLNSTQIPAAKTNGHMLWTHRKVGLRLCSLHAFTLTTHNFFAWQSSRRISHFEFRKTRKHIVRGVGNMMMMLFKLFVQNVFSKYSVQAGAR